MSSAPQLSIVLPVRDVSAYLPDMLVSLRRNAADLRGRLEIIVVDDASDDATPELAEEFGSSLPLQVIRQSVAMGASSARNVGLDVATGTYVTFLDGDDWLGPGYLLDLVTAIDGLGVDFVRVDHVQVRDRERVLHVAPEARRGVVLDPRSGIGPANRRTMVDYPYAWAGIYRRELGETLRFEPGLHTATDRAWIFQLHREARSFAVASLAGVFYRRQVATSLTQLNDERQLHFVDAYAAVLRDIPGDVPGDDEIVAKAVRQFLAVLAHHLAAEERFGVETRALLHERATALLASMPREVVLQTVRYDRRLDAVQPLLPAGLLPRAAASVTASPVFCAATLSGALTLSAALDAGLFGDRTQRRLLLVSSNVAVPELVPSLDESAPFAMLRDRFDDVVRWNDIVAPMHPTHWLPPEAEVPMLARLFTDRLGLRDGVTELVVDSITAAPAAAIALLLRDCPITVYAEDLSAYGPTERTPRPGIGRRVERLLHLDLVPELAPLLLSEYAVDAVALPDAALTQVAAGADSPDVADGAGAAVIVGQHLEELGIMTRREQAELHLRMLRALAARGERQIVFCPHPGDAHAPVSPLRAAAEELDVELTVTADSLPVDAWLAAARPSLVVSCFATELVAAPRRHGLEVASLGCEDVLERLTPFENSLRIPATIVDATVPRLADDGGITAPPAVDVPRLVSAVAYCMQADRLPALRGAAESHLAEQGRTRYFKRRRLEALGFIAPPPPQPAPAPPPPRTRPGKGLLAGARAAAAKRLPH